MKLKLRITIFLMLILALCVVLASCDGGTGSTQNPETPNTTVGDSEWDAILAAGDFRLCYYLTPESYTYSEASVKDDKVTFRYKPEREGYVFIGIMDVRNKKLIVDEQGNYLGGYDWQNTTNIICEWAKEDITLRLRGYTMDNRVIGVKTVTVKYGTLISELPPADFHGYGDFRGWHVKNEYYKGTVTDADGKMNTPTLLNSMNFPIIDGEFVDFKAYVDPVNFTITLDFNDGREGEKQTYEYEYLTSVGGNIFVTEEKDNRAIIGWAYDPEGNEMISSGFYIRDNLTAYAIWREFKDVNVHGAGGVTAVERVFEGNKLTLSGIPPKGVRMHGWYTTPDFQSESMVTYPPYSRDIEFSDLVSDYYMDYTAIVYTLTFNTGCDQTVEEIQYTVFDDDFSLPILSRDNYTFHGWRGLYDNNTTEVVCGTAKTATLVAVWRGHYKTAMFASGTTTTAQSVEYGSEFTLPVANGGDDKLFIGWFDAAEGGNAVTDKDGKGLGPWEYDENILLYPRYEELYLLSVEIPKGSYSVSAEDGGLFLRSGKYYMKPGTVVTVKFEDDKTHAFSKLYDIWDNYITDSSEYVITAEEKDVYLKAAYEPKTFIITVTTYSYEYYFGEIDNEVKWGENYTLPKAYREGYIFTGWYAYATRITDSSGKSLVPYSFSGSVEIYPSFERAQTASTFVYDSETFLAMQNDPSGTYTVINSFTLDDENFTPFAFSGSLYGDDKTITLNLSSANGNLGLFTTLSGTVSSLNIELNVESTSSDSSVIRSVGGVAAVMTGGKISLVTVSGNISGIYSKVGGIVGSMTGGQIHFCENRATVSGSSLVADTAVGGIVGHMSAGEIRYTENYGTVRGERNVGGIVGFTFTDNLKTLENHGQIEANGNYVGGIIGRLSMNAVTNSLEDLENYATVHGLSYVGGIAGDVTVTIAPSSSNEYSSSLTLLKSTGAVRGENYVGGIIGNLSVSATDKLGASFYAAITATELTATATVEATGAYVGGIIGHAYSDSPNSLISNVEFSSAVTGLAFVGGIVGYAEGGVAIADSVNTGISVSGAGRLGDASYSYGCIGGIVGFGGKITNCRNEARVEYAFSSPGVGGIAGLAEGAVNDCHNSGSVNAPNADGVGGVVGLIQYSNSISISRISNTGAVVGKKYVGGVIGNFVVDIIKVNYDYEFTVTLTDLENSGAVSGDDYVGGVAGRIYIDIDAYLGYKVTLVAVFSGFKNSANVTANDEDYAGGVAGDIHARADTSWEARILGYECTGTLNGRAISIGSGFLGNTDGVTVILQ